LLDYAWIEDIKREDHYRLLKTVAHVHLVVLTPPERKGGNLRLDFINRHTYPDDEDDVLLASPRCTSGPRMARSWPGPVFRQPLDGADPEQPNAIGVDPV